MRKSIFIILCLTSLILIVCLASLASLGCDDDEPSKTEAEVTDIKLTVTQNPLACGESTTVTAEISFRVPAYAKRSTSLTVELWDNSTGTHLGNPTRPVSSLRADPSRWPDVQETYQKRTVKFDISCTKAPNCFVQGNVASSGESTADLYVEVKDKDTGEAIKDWEDHNTIVTFDCTACEEEEEETEEEVVEEEEEEEEQTIGGIGIGISLDEEGKPVVVVVLDAYPAYTAGIEVGDHILSVDGKDVEGKDIVSIQEDIIGLINTEVKIRYYDVSEGKIKEVNIMRVPTSTEIIVDEALEEGSESEEEPTEETTKEEEKKICPRCGLPIDECECQGNM